MPKIEVNENMFFKRVGKIYDYDTLEKKLTCAKAELDEKPDKAIPENERVIKIELNDTNRPDLWSTNGVARQLFLYDGGKASDYSSFMSYKDNIKKTCRTVTVDAALKDIRPYMVSFIISGKPIDEPMLLDVIQTQEKIAWNFGRKRKSISMGVYRAAQIKFPVHYKAVDPDKTSFVPLQCEDSMTCREILSKHPKGKDYGWIIAGKEKFPLLMDDTGEVMSMAPVINSATLGAVKVGDKDLMVELTGDNMENLILSANIVACDFADCGYTIIPVKVIHPYDTGFGREVTVPYYFQKPLEAHLSNINKKLGSDLQAKEVVAALERMGDTVTVKNGTAGDTIFTLMPPPYRNDFLHEVDIIEDIMIGVGLDQFEAQTPSDFTIGRLLPVTLYSRKVKTLMVGLGYQEMVFNYLGSRADYIDKAGYPCDKVIEIANPMSENYQFVRPSIIASLLKAESTSASAVFPHKIFEIGKVACIFAGENTGTKTQQNIGFLLCSSSANFNEAASDVSALLYYLGYPYKVEESDDNRFIQGRQAFVIAEGKAVGVFGEVHPQILSNWNITTPCVASELNIEALMMYDQKKEMS